MRLLTDNSETSSATLRSLDHQLLKFSIRKLQKHHILVGKSSVRNGNLPTLLNNAGSSIPILNRNIATRKNASGRNQGTQRRDAGYDTQTSSEEEDDDKDDEEVEEVENLEEEVP